MTEEAGVPQVEPNVEASIAPVRAPEARDAPAVDGQAGLGEAARVGGAGCLGEANTVGIARTGGAGLAEDGEVPDEAGVAEAVPALALARRVCRGAGRTVGADGSAL